ncbi:MAG: circadian phase modifier CpmA, partial [Pseudomonadota bacterium]|nr:circadian phase modifier CpmA [Pseudomonadota bacterium]
LLLQLRLYEFRSHMLFIVVAGRDGALVLVIGGLLAAPLIAVPTSTGYGAARGGETALAAALASCAPGVLACNIDNGYGAACAAIRILGSGAT